MLRINRYEDRRTGNESFSIESFHNNKYTHKGVFSKKGLDSYLKAVNRNNITMVNVKSKRDLFPMELMK